VNPGSDNNGGFRCAPPTLLPYISDSDSGGTPEACRTLERTPPACLCDSPVTIIADGYYYLWLHLKTPARNGHISAPLRRRCRSYNAPAQAAPHRVRSSAFPAHPPLLLCRVTERISDFGRRGYLVLSAQPSGGSHQARMADLTTASFRFLIGSHTTVLSLVGQPVRVSSDTFALICMLPPFKAHDRTFTSQLMTMPVTPRPSLRSVTV